MIVFTANFAAWALNSPSGKISVLPESLDSSKYKRGFLEFLPVGVGDSTGGCDWKPSLNKQKKSLLRGSTPRRLHRFACPSQN